MHCRILYLVGQLRPGGLERQLCYLLLAMDRERYRPAVAVWNYVEEDAYVSELRALGIPLYSFSNRSSAVAKLVAFRHSVKQLKPEIVHSYSFYTNFAAHWAAWGMRAISLGSVRSDFIRSKEKIGPWLGALCGFWPRVQIFNSATAAETVGISGSVFVPKRVFVVRNGIDLRRFPKLPLPGGSQTQLLGVGSLLPVKRWDRLLVAALKLKQQGVDCIIRIAGDGPLRRTLEQQAQDLGLARMVGFLGHVNDISKLLSDAAFLVHTSDNEGCPNVIMEAMACGRAVVAMDVGEIPKLIEDGKTGFVVGRGNVKKFVERVTTLIKDRDLCRRMGEAGQARAAQQFGLRRLVTETLAAYRAAGWKGCP